MSYLIRRGLVGFKFKIHSRMIFTTQKWSSDRINPKASSLVSCDPFQPVALRMEESGPGSMPPISVQGGDSIKGSSPAQIFTHFDS